MDVQRLELLCEHYLAKLVGVANITACLREVADYVKGDDAHQASFSECLRHLKRHFLFYIWEHKDGMAAMAGRLVKDLAPEYGVVLEEVLAVAFASEQPQLLTQLPAALRTVPASTYQADLGQLLNQQDPGTHDCKVILGSSAIFPSVAAHQVGIDPCVPAVGTLAATCSLCLCTQMRRLGAEHKLSSIN